MARDARGYMTVHPALLAVSVAAIVALLALAAYNRIAS